MYKFKRKVINHLGKVFHPGMVVPDNIPPFAIAEMVRVGDVIEITNTQVISPFVEDIGEIVEEEIQPVVEEIEEWQDAPIEELPEDTEEENSPVEEIPTPKRGRKKKENQ
jgi:hypothetical protein